MKKKYVYPKYYSKNIDVKEVIEKRYNILIFVVLAVFIILGFNLFIIQIVKKDYYTSKANYLSSNIVYGDSAPRGRIYDRNGVLLVDNKAVRTIYYKKNSSVSTKMELELAKEASKVIELDYTKISKYNLKNYWLKINSELAKEKISAEEWKMLEERKLTLNDIENLKMERITDAELDAMEVDDLKAAYMYYLMNFGYSYSLKTIKENATDSEYAYVAESINTLLGFNVKLDWERVYLHGNTFRSILGTVSDGLPSDLKDHYLNLGYNLNDRVGSSYLEYQYEDILRGTKTKYKVLQDGTYEVIEEGKRGNDIVLTIDIELQKYVEEVLKEEIVATKSEPNTKYYNRSFALIADPNTGEILAMSGKQVLLKNGEYVIYDYTPGITTSPVAVGSIIKGAGQIVGYNTGALKIGEIRNDSCLKIASTPMKCTWTTTLGNIDDITAIKHSSNVYQFLTAINVGKGKYIYDKPISIDPIAFDIYRNTFNEFGLGVKTGIDLPIESLGYIGTSTKAGYLLDFVIGQYDTYTPIQLMQYMSTIANGGYRMQPYLLKSVYAPTSEPLTEVLKTTSSVVLNKVNTLDIYLNRVKEALIEVIKGGTGYGYVDLKYKPAGKTGTSESFIDTDNDGVIDTETQTKTFSAYAPYDNPKVVFTVLSPDFYYNEGRVGYYSNVNKRITYRISKKYFDIYQ